MEKPIILPEGSCIGDRETMEMRGDAVPELKQISSEGVVGQNLTFKTVVLRGWGRAGNLF